MLNTLNTRASEVGDTLVRASRQFWLAGLGAAVVTRDWAEKEGGVVFRNLVREGTAIESRAIRYVGDRLEMSFAQANTIWKRTRRTVTTTVKTYADTRVDAGPRDAARVAAQDGDARHRQGRGQACRQAQGRPREARGDDARQCRDQAREAHGADRQARLTRHRSRPRGRSRSGSGMAWEGNA